MAFTLDDLIGGVRKSRQHLLKHLNGLRDDQWDWKPYPECKSIRETLAHLIVDDRAALQSMSTGKEPDYEGLSGAVQAEGASDVAKLRAALHESHEELCAFLRTNYADVPLDTAASLYGTPDKLGSAVAYLSAEDFYHAGQIAYVRMATDPAWDYYAAIYGPDA